MLPEDNPIADLLYARIQRALPQFDHRPLVLGLCGAQGSGKSTLAAGLADRCRASGIATAVLSIDDLYLTRAEREALARDVHPLLRTRGVPGTHDVRLGLKLFDELSSGQPIRLPRFDKAQDDRAAPEQWEDVASGTEVLIFEGWCVGAWPEPDPALVDPINTLERDEDRNGTWRTFANAALAGDYQTLFARVDLLTLLAAPDFTVVHAWRTEQERDLRLAGHPDAVGVMSDFQVTRFVQHYERLTRHILTEMPARADIVISLADDRRPVGFSDCGVDCTSHLGISLTAN